MAPVNVRLNSSLVRDIHTRVVLNAIRKKTSTRTELAKGTGLSVPTVGTIVNTLQEEGYIVNERLGEFRGGRKPMLLRFVPTARLIIGVNLSGTGPQVVLADLNGDFVSPVLTSTTAELEQDLSGTVIKLIAKLQETKKFPWDKIAGIGLSVRGSLDISDSLYFYPTILKPIPLQTDLEEHFQVPVLLERNSNAAALAEFAARKLQDLAFVNLDHGVSSGLIMGGKLCRGFLGNAGELGHVVISTGEKKCPQCGQRGCLETLVSLGGLVEAGEKAGLDLDKNLSELESYKKLVHLSKEGNEVAGKVFLNATELIGRALVLLVNIVNPQVIVLGGNVIWHYPELLTALEEYVSGHAWPFSRQELVFAMTLEDKHVFLRGAVTLILDQLFASYNSSMQEESKLNVQVEKR